MALVRLADVEKRYDSQEVLRGVDVSVERGEVVAIQGASGTGKSTLLNILGLLDRADSGSYQLDGEEILQADDKERTRLRAERIGIVFQGFHLLPEFTVLENILMPGRCVGRPLGQLKKRAETMLNQIGLDQHASRDVTTLSGGERQRVALCRALLLSPALVLADEPTGNLDPATADVVLRQLLDLAGESSAVILVTHDPAIAGQAHRRLLLQDGRLGSPDSAPEPQAG